MGVRDFTGRLGSLGAVFTVGVVILAGGSGVAWADEAESARSTDTNSSTSPAAARQGGSAFAEPPQRARGRSGSALRRKGVMTAPAAATGAAMPSGAHSRLRPASPELPAAALNDTPHAGSAPAAAGSVTTALLGGEIGQTAAGMSAQHRLPAAAVAVAADPIGGFFASVSAFFNNQTPRLNPIQLGQSPSGVVSGHLNPVDPDSPLLSFTITQAPAHGTALVNGDGSYSYTPGAQAAVTGITDSFQVMVSDAPSGFAIHGLAGLINLLTFGMFGRRGDSSTSPVPVTVIAVGPLNHAPTGTASITATDPMTGVVTGAVRGSDDDGDALTYGGSATTAHGVVIVTAAGEFTYSPTSTARHNAASLTATAADRRDDFAVTVSDGRGAVTTVPVSVVITGANIAPVAGVPAVDEPNVSTGVVTGTLNASDPDGDSLVFTAPTVTDKGTVGINSSTGAFTYTPTVAARQNAAAPGATDADRQDTFAVTISDGHGGTTTAAVRVQVGAASEPAPVLAAFPGAEGFGASATGGRGGTVVYVTNLDADGPGSLQWAIDQPGAKYILFKVSGVIDAQIHLTNGDVTIAGQTSPGGITLRGFVTDESPYQDQAVRAPTDFAENWILQHIRIRPGSSGPSDDGLRLRYTRNAIVDHVSIGNAIDEALEISYSNNITVQNTLIAETLGGHAFYGGVLMNYSNPAYGFELDNVSLHHNVFNRIEGRLPEGSRESAAAAGSFMNLELSNNLYWDPRFFIALGVDTAVAGGQPIYWKLNAVNNYFRTANGFPYGMFDDQILNVAGNELYVSGNRMNLYPTRSDYQLFYCCNDYPSETSPNATSRRAQDRIERHPFPAITYTPTDQLRSLLLNTAGAWPRDPMDIRLMQSVATDTIASAAPNVNPAGDALLPAYSGGAPVAPVDSDNDGMPDSWEVARGLNPNLAGHNDHTLSSVGYTDLEVYLYELSASRVSGWSL